MSEKMNQPNALQLLRNPTVIKFMFLTELTPALQKFIQQPVAFAGGFVSGILQLKLNEEPLSQWLEQQGYNSVVNNNSATPNNSDRPQSINID